MILFRNRIIADIIKEVEDRLGSGGSLIHMTGILIRRRPCEDTDPPGKYHGMMRAERGVL